MHTRSNRALLSLSFLLTLSLAGSALSEEPKSASKKPALEEQKPESPPEPVLSAEVAEPAVPVPAGEAESRFGLVLAPKAGATIPTSKLGTTLIGSLEVGYDFPFLAPSLGIAVPGISVEFSYVEPGLSGSGTSAVAGDYTYSLSQRLLILSIDAVVTLEFGDFAPYTALGYGFYILHAAIDSFGMTNSEDQLRSGLQARAGLTYQLWHGGIFAEIKYHWVGLEFLSTGESSGAGISFGSGYRFRF